MEPKPPDIGERYKARLQSLVKAHQEKQAPAVEVNPPVLKKPEVVRVPKAALSNAFSGVGFSTPSRRDPPKSAVTSGAMNDTIPLDYASEVKQVSEAPGVANEVLKLEDFEIIERLGDGDCLFNSLLDSLGMDVRHSYSLRQLICDDILTLDMVEPLIEHTAGVSREAYCKRMANPGEWGTEQEIIAFCRILNCRVIILSEDLSSGRVRVTEKLNECTIPDFDLYIHFGTYFGMVKYEGANHYSGLRRKDATDRRFNYREYCDILKAKLVEFGGDEPETEKKRYAGSYVKKEKTCTDMEVVPFTERNSRDTSPYTVKERNEDLPEHMKVDFFFEDENGNIESPQEKFSGQIKSLTSGGIKSAPKNIVIDSDMDFKQLNDKYKLSEAAQRDIRWAVCIRCSGLNKDRRPCYVTFADLLSLKMHVKRSHKSDGKIGKGSVINIGLPEGYTIVETKKDMKGLVIMKWTDIPKEGGSNSMSVLGWNSRSVVSPVNSVLFKKYITEKTPDIVLLNENGSLEKKFLVGTGYKSVSVGNWTAVVYNDKYNVHTALPLWNNEFNTIVKLNSEGRSAFLYSFYKSHRLDEEDQLDQLLYRLSAIKDRYSDLSLILYGDFNMGREAFKRKVENRLPDGYVAHYSEERDAVTRKEMKLGRPVTSYLDYFITFGCVTGRVEIMEAIGRSDHMTLKLLVDKGKSLLKPTIRKICTNVTTKVRVDWEKNHGDFVGAILSYDPLGGVIEHIRQMRRRYKTRVVKPNNVFNINEKIRQALADSTMDWKRLERLIRRVRTEEYTAFLEKIEELRMTRKHKEYFLKMRFYTQINANVDILKELELPSGQIVTDKDEMNMHLYNKYLAMFTSGKTYPYNYDRNDLILVTNGDIERALYKMSTGKAVSGDMLCDKSIEAILKLRGKDIRKYLDLVEGLTVLISQVIASECIPDELQTARLIFLNKTAGETGKIDNVRPISIDGVVIKLLEAVIASRIEDHVYGSDVLHRNQTGFMRHLGTEVNLFKFREFGRQAIGKGGGYVLFTDFKAAYDSVDHEILFIKMRSMRFPSDLVNTVIKFYSSAKTQVGDRVINVTRGVLQGNLFSPMLFNIYIDDLMRQLTEYSLDSCGYADDLVTVCRDRIELKCCISILNRWSRNNGIDINHKKSGIMRLKGPKFVPNRELLGYPLVREYRYLGVIVDDKLTCPKQVHVVTGRIDKYFRRNRMLIHKHFSTGALVQLWALFQKSRLVYGMSAFADDATRMAELKVALLKHLKGILRLPKNTKTSRICATLGLTKFKYVLQLQLARTMCKYAERFGSIPPRNVGLIKMLDERFNLGIFSSPEFQYDEWLRMLNERYTHGKVMRLVTHMVPMNYSSKLWEIYYVCDGRDSMMVKYFCNIGFFRNRFRGICQHCGAENSREHAVDDCVHYDSLRCETIERLRRFFPGDRLSTMLSKIYFSGVKVTKRDYRYLVKELKSFITTLYMTQEVEREGGSV